MGVRRATARSVLCIAALMTTACGSGSDEVTNPSAVEAVSGDTAAPGSASPTAAGSTPPTSDVAISGLTDPLPDATQPGVVTCAGCPTVAGIDDLEPAVGSETTFAFTGEVSGATGEGVFYVVNAEGQSLGGAIPIEETGLFGVTVPLFCGPQTVKLAWHNDSGTAGVVLTPSTSACTAYALRVTLTWGELGDDFELHLVREGGTINDRTDNGSISNDCTWTTCIGASPDWGVIGDPSDDPVKDIDDTGSYGPENIILTGPEAITYTVLVEHWDNGDPGADGEVIINVEGGGVVAVPITDLAPLWVMTVATIEFPSGTITPIAEQYDCKAEWGLNGGCGAALPS